MQVNGLSTFGYVLPKNAEVHANFSHAANAHNASPRTAANAASVHASILRELLPDPRIAVQLKPNVPGS